MSVKVTGSLPDFSKAAIEVQVLAKAVVAKTAADIEAKAKENVPVRTGNLKNSISHTVDGFTAEIGPTASYGSYVELGTSRMAPQPYLIPAAEEVQPLFEAALEQVADKILGD